MTSTTAAGAPDSMTPVLILGTGGGAMEIAYLLIGCGREIAGFLGPEPDCALPGAWLGGDDELNRLTKGPSVLAAVGAPALRRKLFGTAAAAGFPIGGFVHPRAFVAPGVSIGEGAVVYPNATLQAGVSVGRGAVVNANASVGHETAIGAFCSINPGADIAGRVTLGDECYVGIGAAIVERLQIAPGTVIGAGATVIRSISDAGTWVGTPARRLGELMAIFASTTSLGTGRTELPDVLAALAGLDLDGVEIGSTHRWRPDFEDCIGANWQGPLLTHNYCPPAEEDLVINLGSADPLTRAKSLDHASACVRFAARVGARAYTVHAGFVAEVQRAAADPGAKAFDFTYGAERSDRAATVERIVAALNQLMATARESGVDLAVETEGSLTSPDVFAFETADAYEDLLGRVPGLRLNFNLAHSSLAAKARGFDLGTFIDRLGKRFIACEISHNDGHHDSHASLEPGSPALEWIGRLPPVPLILEFRGASVDDMRRSIELAREAL